MVEEAYEGARGFSKSTIQARKKVLYSFGLSGKGARAGLALSLPARVISMETTLYGARRSGFLSAAETVFKIDSLETKWYCPAFTRRLDGRYAYGRASYLGHSGNLYGTTAE